MADRIVVGVLSERLDYVCNEKLFFISALWQALFSMAPRCSKKPIGCEGAKHILVKQL